MEPVGSGPKYADTDTMSRAGAVVESVDDHDSNGRMHHMGRPRNKDMLFAVFLLNLAMLWFLSVSVIINAKDVKFFTFDWTRRLESTDGLRNMTQARENIALAYINNRKSDHFSLGEMMEEMYRNASCRPVRYDGGLSWMSHEVSPTCNCLRNLHVAYIKAVRPNNVGLDENDFKNPENVGNTTLIVTAMKEKCFDMVRPTQFEDIAPGSMQTNLVSNTLYWNVIGTSMSLFVLFFDGVVYMTSSSAHSPGSDPPYSLLCWTHMGSAAKILLFMVLAALTWTPMFFNLMFIAENQAIRTVPLVFSTLFMGLVILVVMWEQRDVKQNNAYPVRKNIVYWISFALTVPLVCNSIYMLLQRRDALLNWVTLFSIVAAALCALGIEFMQAAFSYAFAGYDRRYQKYSSGLGSNSEAIFLYSHRKNTMIMVVMGSILVIVVLLTAATFPWFPSSSFSNTYISVPVVGALLGIPPLIFPGRYLTKMDVTVPLTRFSVRDLWSQGLISVEMLARFVFTTGILSDVWGIMMHDYGASEAH